MDKRPVDIQPGQEITAKFLNGVKNSSPVRIIGGVGIRVRQHGKDLIIEKSGGGRENFPLKGIFDNQPTIGAASEGSETADTTTWDRDAQVSGERGVRVYMLSRVVYNDAGDETLYAFVRYCDYDHLGHLKYISAETRLSVDVAEGC